MLWQLHINRNVVSYFVSLREQGHALRQAIFSLQSPEKILASVDLVVLSQNIYLWRTAGHMITFEVKPELQQIYVSAVAAQKEDVEEE